MPLEAACREARNAPAATAGAARGALRAVVLPGQQFRQLAGSFAAIHRASSRVSSLAAGSSAGLVLEIEIAEHLPDGVFDDEAVRAPWIIQSGEKRRAAGDARPATSKPALPFD